MLQTTVINSILCSVSAYFVCYLFQMFRGIGHGDACSNCFQHFDVIVAIPKSDCLFRIQVVISQHSLDCSPFSAICRNNIDRPIPPCCYFGMGNVFHDQWIILFITSQHDLIDFFLQQIIKTFYNPGNEPLSVMQAMARQPVLWLSEKDAAAVSALFLQIRDETGMDSSPSPRDSEPAAGGLGNLYVTNKLIEIVIRFLRAQTGPERQQTERPSDPSQIFLYLYSHLHQKITLSQLSKIFFMSESAISAYITHTTGLSFFDLLNEMRIGKTINYLLYTDFTLEELAEILGFVDSAHISKVFLARIGMNANAFRSTYQKVGNICHIRDRREFYALVSYIYRHYSEDLHPRAVGEKFHMSPRELNRILLYQVEMGFAEFLSYVRVNRASELLLETDKTILEIALEVGFHSEKTLSRHFLRFRAMTPGKFRQTVELQKPR